MFNRADSALRGFRPVCHHNFRPTTARRIAAGHGAVCLLCICERIDEFFENDSGNIPPAQKVNDIMHNVRLIHTTLDSYDRMDGALSEITVRPVIDTLIGLLKLANDEIGLMIAQAVQMICSKITTDLQNYLLEKVICQIRESPTGLTLGVVECLRVILQIEECLVVFQEKFGQEILPIVLQALLSRGNVERRRGFPSQNRLFYNTTDSPCDTNINSQENVSQNSFSANGQGYMEDKYRTIIAIYAVIERTYEILPSGGSTACSMDVDTSSSTEKDTMYHEFMPYTRDIIADCIKIMNECVQLPVLIQVLGVLAKVVAHLGPLSNIISSGQGYSLLAQVKKMLFSPYREVQKRSLVVLVHSVETYRTALITSFSERIENPIEDLPRLMFKVDLLHGLSQTISNSDSEIYGIFFQLLRMFHAIPFFKGKLLTLVEDALRFSALSSSPECGLHGIHQFFQGVLNETQIERLQWAKLLLHCSDGSLHSVLLQFFNKSVELLQSNVCSVSHLKLALALYCAVVNCSEQEKLTNAENTQPPFLLTLMKIKCLPAIKALATEGNASEALYIRILLLLLLEFPVDRLKPPRKKMSIDSQHHSGISFFAVEYEIEDDDSCSSIARTQEVVLSQNNLFDEDGNWSGGACMKILSWIRLNMELLQDKPVFDLWNENVGRIVTAKAPQYFPGISILWPQIPPAEENNSPVRRTFFSAILDKLDLDMTKWSELLGQNSVKNMEIDDNLMLRQEAALVYYYYYFLFTMDDEKTVLPPTFIANLSQLLQNTVDNLDVVASSQRPKEDLLSAYFKLSFLIVACRLPSLDYHPELLNTYQSMILELESVLDEDPQKVVTYCGIVFHILMEWQLFPLFQLCIMINTWAEEDKEQFQIFFMDIDLSFSNYNEDSVASYKAIVLEIAAEGSEETSEFIVNLIDTKRSKSHFNFEPYLIYDKLIQKKNDIVAASSAYSCTTAEVGVTLSSYLKNFSSLLELAMGDEPMFCKEIINFPVEFFDDVIQILLKFYQTKPIGATCMKFLLKYLSFSSNIVVQRICLQNHAFVHLLGSFIQKPDTAATYELTCYSYDILSTLVRACDIPEDYRMFWKQGSDKVKWRVSSVLNRIRATSNNISWLKFLTDMLASDLKHDVIEVEEMEMDHSALWSILLTINFYVQNLVLKASKKEDEDVIWNFFFELLYFSIRMDRGSTAGGTKENTILSGRFFGDPWNALLIEISIQNVRSPVDLSEPCLKYLLKWMKTIVTHLRLAGKRNLLVAPNVPYQVCTVLGLILKLYDFFGCGQVESSVENLNNISNVENGIDERNAVVARFPTRNVAEDEKKTLIEKLVKYCTIILETHQGKELCGYTSDDEDKSLRGENIGAEMEIENVESNTVELVQASKSNLSTTISSYEPNESGSSTCSESELESLLKTSESMQFECE